MKHKNAELINMIETIFLTAQHRGDLFSVLAEGFREAESRLKELYAGNESAGAILTRLHIFIEVSEIVHTYHEER